MNPEKHGINMRLKNMADLIEFERKREGERDRDRDGDRDRESWKSFKEFYQRYNNIISLVL